MFYADQKDKFGVEYYGIHAQWLYDVIVSGRTDDYRLHTYAGIKHLRNYPVSRSLAEDHRRTAFFGVSPIQCTSVNLTDDEIELFKKSVRGTLQGAIRVDVSIKRLVAGLTGKEATMSVEDFLRSDTTIANTVAKHYGSLVVNCREKPLCSYAQWSVHCRLAYRICLEKAFLSPFYTGSEIDGPADEATMKTLAAAHQAMNETVSRMREQMTLKTEESAMAKFRTTMKSAERFKRYLRMDSEGLSMLLAT